MMRCCFVFVFLCSIAREKQDEYSHLRLAEIFLNLQLGSKGKMTAMYVNLKGI